MAETLFVAAKVETDTEPATSVVEAVATPDADDNESVAAGFPVAAASVAEAVATTGADDDEPVATGSLEAIALVCPPTGSTARVAVCNQGF